MSRATPRDHGRPVAPSEMARTGAAPPPFAFRAGVTPRPGHGGASHLPAADGLETSHRKARATGDDPGVARTIGDAIRLGADLHDGGWWWEAHEAWEVAWRAWPRHDPRARRIQALIQDAAAWIQIERGRIAGAMRLAARAGANREAATADDPRGVRWLGLDHAERQAAVHGVVAEAARIGRMAIAGVPPLPDGFPSGESHLLVP